MTPRTLVRAGVRIGVLLPFALAVATVVSVMWPALVPRHMLLFAHHGDLSRWPENSLEGLLAAAETGIDGLEIDVARSADGTWWMIHDDTVDRTTDGSGVVGDLSDADLASLTIDGGAGFDPSVHHGLHLHTLDEVLGAVAGGPRLMIDVKSKDGASAIALATLLKARGLTDAFVLCQSTACLRGVKEVDGRFQTVYGAPITWDSTLDVYLAFAPTGVRWPKVPVADLFGDVAMFVPEGYTGDETVYLDPARRWGVFLSVVNDPRAALVWRARVEP
jgi:glycerophosphoryl diester phosphodiesterase